MRTAFFQALAEAAAADPDIVLIAGPEGLPAVEAFGTALPEDRFYGISGSDASVMGVAVGMAMNEHRVFVYSLAPFVTLHALEFLRNDVCPAQLPVVVAGVGAGYASGHQTFTHPALDDVAVMRALPGMTVIAPADPSEVHAAVRSLAKHDGPAYLRIADDGEPVFGNDAPPFAVGRARLLRDGRDVTMIGCGRILTAALDAAATLEKSGVSARVIDMATVAPVDADAIRNACRDTRALMTIEEHGTTGGLGAAVGEVLATMPTHPPLKKLGFQKALTARAGNREYLLAEDGLNGDGIVRQTRALLDSLRA